MRTTLTLEPDVAQRLHRRMAQRKLPLKRVVNDALRAGLAHLEKERPVRFSVEPHACGFKAGIDPDKLNQLTGQLESEEAARTLAG